MKDNEDLKELTRILNDALQLAGFLNSEYSLDEIARVESNIQKSIKELESLLDDE